MERSYFGQYVVDSDPITKENFNYLSIEQKPDYNLDKVIEDGINRESKSGLKKFLDEL